ncbi:MAG: hypothetical protein AAB532_01915, partial [Patescibacteria group bacterium]
MDIKKFDEELQKEDVGYDHKHILNTAPGQTPNIDIDTLAKGVTYEQLKSLNVPVYEYKTQITIHGIFPGNIERYCYGYQSLIVNKNLSLGVRWTAIDREKKEAIRQAAYLLPEKKWCVDIDSRGMSIYQTVELSKIEELKRVYATIPDIFFGDKQIIKSSYFQMAMLKITFSGIKIDHLWEFIGFLTDGKITNQEEFETRKAIYEKEKEEKHKKWLEEWAEEKAEKEITDAEEKAKLTQEITESQDFVEAKPEINGWYLSLDEYTNEFKVSFFYKAIGKMYYKHCRVPTMAEAKKILIAKDVCLLYCRKGYEAQAKYLAQKTYYQLKEEKKEIKNSVISNPTPITLSKNNQVKITRNESKNGIEIAFICKPSEAVLTMLKAYHFRWSKYQKIWY